ncbi:hypothetical protein [Streptomyces sp. NBC_01462]|uniref:hypothetical protein n=1 Tax=Streptomyces sp. NBC_01462 TaxID=2903876 RepID=UPI002E31E6C0|nr:hypothetical protein [Streptomyces sp. NBC_01462]
MFTARRLAAPWALSPSTTDPDTVREWLTWTTVGVEGVVFARLDDPYRPAVRGWLKYKVRETTEAIVGAITGPLSVPRRGSRTPTARKALLTTRRYPARAWAWSSPPLRRHVARHPGADTPTAACDGSPSAVTVTTTAAMATAANTL